MTHFYSVLAFATTSQQYEEWKVFIEPGINIFTVTTDSIDALVAELKADGHRVDRVTRLDEDQHDFSDLGSDPKRLSS